MGRLGKKVLTDRGVKTNTIAGYHSDASCQGLYLSIRKTSSGISRSWIYRYTSPTNKRRRDMGLGSIEICSLADARHKANNFRLRVSQGIDPLDESSQDKLQESVLKKSKVTFDQAVEQFIAVKGVPWKSCKHRQQWINTLNQYASPTIGNLYIDQITTDLIVQILQPIWLLKKETAHRVQQRIKMVIDWCIAKQYFDGKNTADMTGPLQILLPTQNRIKSQKKQSSLPFEEIHEFVEKIRLIDSPSAKALELIILTATRTNEVVSARWSEIDFPNKIWTIPGERTKSGRIHRVPLCNRAIEILNIMNFKKFNGFIFPGRSLKVEKSMSTGTAYSMMKKMDHYNKYCPHGFRATFRTWGSNQDFHSDTLELCLGHVIGSKTVQSYDRSDQLEKRREILKIWNEFIEISD